MKKNILTLAALTLGVCLLLSACGDGDVTVTPTPLPTETAQAETVLAAPTDFDFDPNTGEYSFEAADENMGYYFIRFYKLEDGRETGEYVVSSNRINGGKAGTFTGTIDLSEISWGAYHVNLTSFAPAGSGYTSPDPIVLTVQYGVGVPLERPEMLVMASGNQVELVVDWWTLCDYHFRQYLPDMKFTFYSDPACTDEVFSDTVDLAPLADTLDMNPPGWIYIWGYSKEEGQHLYLPEGYDPNYQGTMFDPGPQPLYFKNDLYTYTLDPGTYYVTCQALSKDEYALDSQASTAVEFTLTDSAPTSEFTQGKTELWADPQQMDMPGANPGQQPDRVDYPVVSAQIIG